MADDPKQQAVYRRFVRERDLDRLPERTRALQTLHELERVQRKIDAAQLRVRHAIEGDKRPLRKLETLEHSEAQLLALLHTFPPELLDSLNDPRRNS